MQYIKAQTMSKNPFDDAEKQISQDLRYSSTELQKISAIAEGVKQLQDYFNILALTELNGEQIALILKLKTEAKYMDIPQLNEILQDFAIMKLSEGRKSRDEIVRVLIGMSGKKSLKEKVQGLVKKNDGGDE
jgi:hypothetical protein